MSSLGQTRKSLTSCETPLRTSSAWMGTSQEISVCPSLMLFVDTFESNVARTSRLCTFGGFSRLGSQQPALLCPSHGRRTPCPGSVGWPCAGTRRPEGVLHLLSVPSAPCCLSHPTSHGAGGSAPSPTHVEGPGCGSLPLRFVLTPSDTVRTSRTKQISFRTRSHAGHRPACNQQNSIY